MLTSRQDLKGLASCRSNVTLTILGSQIVDNTINIRRDLAGRNLESKHELERFLVSLFIIALQIAILLLIAAMRFEKNHRVFCD